MSRPRGRPKVERGKHGLPVHLVREDNRATIIAKSDRGQGPSKEYPMGGVEVSGWRQIGLEANARDEYKFVESMINHRLLRIASVKNGSGEKIEDGANRYAARCWGMIWRVAGKLAGNSQLKQGTSSYPQSQADIARRLAAETRSIDDEAQLRAYLEAKLPKSGK